MLYKDYPWKDEFGEAVLFDELLSKHATFKIGGPAAIYINANTEEDLVKAFKIVKEENFPYFILGGGSNVVLPDKGFDGVVIHPNQKDLTFDGEIMKASAGTVLAKMAKESTALGLSGFEWGIGVPGTLGGAVRGNAGAFGGEIVDSLVSARVFDGKKIKEFSNEEMDFSYRSSRIKKSKGSEIVLSAMFKLGPSSVEDATSLMKSFLQKKLAHQPFGEPSAGCLFKNVEVNKDTSLRAPSKGNPTERFLKDVPSDFWEKGVVPAGWIIDKLGLKGYEDWGVKVSEKHGNFLVNTGNGTQEGINEMKAYIKQKVKEHYGVDLEEEVQFV